MAELKPQPSSLTAVDSRIISRTLAPQFIANRSKTLSKLDELDRLMQPILRLVHSNYPKAPLDPVMRAYRFAKEAHSAQFRKSGEPFLIHPIAVAQILAELGLGVETICAALLHDTIEDTSVTYEEIVKQFGESVALMVEGVTKLTKIQYGENANAETLRKMIVAMSKDIRVLVIKLADRLHNARTWQYVSANSANSKAKETIEIYAPLAHRLGLNQIKRELEDLSFKTLHPKVYQEIENLVNEYSSERENLVEKVVQEVQRILDEAKIKAKVSGRPKHLYSVYQKMIVRGRDFHDIYDLVGIRIITESILDCYGALGAVHSKWNHLPGRFKDYIAMPKYNMYQSIHSTIIGPENRTIEIQIRTKQMHQFAQFGIAAHWKYKENVVDKGGVSKSSDAIDPKSRENMQWLKQLVDWQDETKDSAEFLDSLRFDLATDQVYAFTPKGEVIGLTLGSTPVDFAYAVHTEVGARTVGAKVNGRMVPLNTELANGDTVEILTSKQDGVGPSRDWMSFVKTQRAKNKIRAYFARERRDDDIEKGKESLSKWMKNKHLPFKRLLNNQILTEIAEELKLKDIEELYAALGSGKTSLLNVTKRLMQKTEDDLTEEIVDELHNDAKDISDSAISKYDPNATKINPGISVSGVESENDVWVKLAKCCIPVPGDEIIGFVTKGAGISVHRQDCYNISVLKEEVEPGRFVETNWIEGAVKSFLVHIQIEGLDRTKLLADVTKVLSENHVSIISGRVETTRDRIALSSWTFEMSDISHLASIMSSVRKIDGVFDVYRLKGK